MLLPRGGLDVHACSGCWGTLACSSCQVLQVLSEPLCHMTEMQVWKITCTSSLFQLSLLPFTQPDNPYATKP